MYVVLLVWICMGWENLLNGRPSKNLKRINIAIMRNCFPTYIFGYFFLFFVCKLVPSLLFFSLVASFPFHISRSLSISNDCACKWISYNAIDIDDAHSRHFTANGLHASILIYIINFRFGNGDRRRAIDR